VEEGGAAAARAGERLLTPRERAAEALFTGLRRREGVDLQTFRSRHGLDPLEEWKAELRDSFAAGLLAKAEGRLHLTDRGVLVSNEVFSGLV
jgi:coproporphyrinogen III oxidase-like Fe-S oxidoreductase